MALNNGYRPSSIIVHNFFDGSVGVNSSLIYVNSASNLGELKHRIQEHIKAFRKVFKDESLFSSTKKTAMINGKYLIFFSFYKNEFKLSMLNKNMNRFLLSSKSLLKILTHMNILIIF